MFNVYGSMTMMLELCFMMGNNFVNGPTKFSSKDTIFDYGVSFFNNILNVLIFSEYTL